jgi:hypothetical protein
MTNGDIWKRRADEMGIPLRTLEQVKADLTDAKKRSKGKNAGMDIALARLMLKAGRLTDEAILYIGDNYPSVWE